LTSVRKIRELPIPGEIKVKLNQRVESSGIVAEASLPGELHILRIPEEMGIEVTDVIGKLQVQEGQRVTKRQIHCENTGLFGLFRTRFGSPLDGTVELITAKTGHVALRLAPKLLSLDAYIGGTVVSINEKKSVTIEARGTFVQGIFGIGGERQGTI